MRNRKIIIIGLVISIVLIGIILIFNNVFVRELEIDDFASCASAGNSVGESYPRQCWTSDGRRFVEEINEIENNIESNLNVWENDDLRLAYIPESNSYECFGCNDILCIDPGFDTDFVKETEDMYCNSDFEVVER